MNGWEQAVAWIVGVAAFLAALGVIVKAARDGWRAAIGSRKRPGWLRRAIRLVDALTGLPERFEALERVTRAHLVEANEKIRLLDDIATDLGVVKAEVKNNGGGSLKDSAHRIERALGLPEPTAHPRTDPTPCQP